ncbi:phosphonopyruvate decarboxylase [Streptomyces noursei]|uniref:phosphonopyruvate decarboxylase n=1 Tax=Streptomyces noursei TaxID=1971 RepID=UPI003330FE26
MISAADFTAVLHAHGVDFVSGVPCSYFNGPLVLLTGQGRYVPAANEGAAWSLAAGATATGVRAAVFAQNSGLGNLINPLTSLSMPYRLPVLLFLSLRGWPDPEGDEPQHAVMGPATHRVLDALGVWNHTLPAGCGRPGLDAALHAAAHPLAQGRPAVVLVPKGTVGTANGTPPPAGPGLRRADAVRALVNHLDATAVVATTGYTARELFAQKDAPHHFYLQGSMGHAAAFGLGVALSRPDERVLVLDGDGAALMHLGSMSTVGATAPPNLVHAVLDNGVYESTGAQPTTATATDFPGIGRATGYRTQALVHDEDQLARAAAALRDRPGPHLLVVRTLAGSGAAPPRATSAMTAVDIHTRFTASFGAPAAWRAR